jgi:hypothetical protein
VEADPMINRSAVLVTPKEPYLRWAEQFPGGSPLPKGRMERTVYLLPEIETPQQSPRVLKAAFARIFEQELWAWDQVEADWPEKRDFKTFLEWFDVEIDTMVLDLCDDDIVDKG